MQLGHVMKALLFFLNLERHDSQINFSSRQGSLHVYSHPLAGASEQPKQRTRSTMEVNTGSSSGSTYLAEDIYTHFKLQWFFTKKIGILWFFARRSRSCQVCLILCTLNPVLLYWPFTGLEHCLQIFRLIRCGIFSFTLLTLRQQNTLI